MLGFMSVLLYVPSDVNTYIGHTNNDPDSEACQQITCILTSQMTDLGLCMYSKWVQLNFSTGVHLLVLPWLLFSIDVTLLVPPRSCVLILLTLE